MVWWMMAANASTLTLTGTCGGVVAADLAGMTPNGTIAIVSSPTAGATPVGVGPCAATVTGLGANRTVQWTGQVGAGGSIHLQQQVPSPQGCGLLVQALDLGTCTVTNVATVASPSSTTQETEPNGTIATADALPGTSGLHTAAGTIDVGVDDDYWRLDLPVAGWTDILLYSTAGDVNSCGPDDPKMVLYNSAGQQILQDDDEAGRGSGYCPHLDPNVFPALQNLAAGTYYVRVQHWSNNSPRPFGYFVDATLP